MLLPSNGNKTTGGTHSTGFLLVDLLWSASKHAVANIKNSVETRGFFQSLAIQWVKRKTSILLLLLHRTSWSLKKYRLVIVFFAHVVLIVRVATVWSLRVLCQPKIWSFYVFQNFLLSFRDFRVALLSNDCLWSTVTLFWKPSSMSSWQSRHP